MTSRRPRRLGPRGRAVALALVIVATAALQVLSVRSDADDLHSVLVRVDLRTRGTRVPADYLGFSIEYGALARWEGAGHKPDPLLVGLIRRVSPSPVLRIGGNSSDESRWDPSGRGRSAEFRHAIGVSWMRSTAALVRALHAHVILGLNLAANRPRIAVEMARAALRYLPRGSIRAFELGNEPDLYGIVPWYQRTDRSRRQNQFVNAFARRRHYRFLGFLRDFGRFARALRAAGIDTPLVGPSWGSPRWDHGFQRFVRDQRSQLGLATAHGYPLRTCHVASTSPEFPTIAHLLAPYATTGLAQRFAGDLRAARREHLPLRIDELNSVSCGGRSGVGDSFASALWVADTLFELAGEGIAGVNIHARPHTYYAPFYLGREHHRWTATVRPEYYGLLMFARATAGGGRLIRTWADGDPRVRVWAIRARHELRLVAINLDPRWQGEVGLLADGQKRPARTEVLWAPAAGATTDVRLAGQAIPFRSRTGALRGEHVSLVTTPTDGVYRFALPPASAILAEIPLAPGPKRAA